MNDLVLYRDTTTGLEYAGDIGETTPVSWKPRGEAEFCTCRAGHMARQYARKVYSRMSDDGRRLACEKVDQAFTELAAKIAVEQPTVHGAEVAG